MKFSQELDWFGQDMDYMTASEIIIWLWLIWKIQYRDQKYVLVDIDYNAT